MNLSFDFHSLLHTRHVRAAGIDPSALVHAEFPGKESDANRKSDFILHKGQSDAIFPLAARNTQWPSASWSDLTQFPRLDLSLLSVLWISKLNIPSSKKPFLAQSRFCHTPVAIRAPCRAHRLPASTQMQAAGGGPDVVETGERLTKVSAWLARPSQFMRTQTLTILTEISLLSK